MGQFYSSDIAGPGGPPGGPPNMLPHNNISPGAISGFPSRPSMVGARKWVKLIQTIFFTSIAFKKNCHVYIYLICQLLEWITNNVNFKI